jgi:hypothetical protein
MVVAKKRLVALVVLAGVALSGCDLSQKDPNFPQSQAPTTFNALFNLTAGQTPWPTDAFFNGTTDLTLNIPAPYNAQPFTAWGVALNTQDGWSTIAPFGTSFNQPINGASFTASSMRVIEVYLSNTTKGPAQGAELPPGVASPVIRVLTIGVDYSPAVSPDIDSAGKILRITPLKPLRPSHGAVNIGYIVLLTNSIEDTSGLHAEPSATYASYKSAPATCSNFTDALSKGFCQLTKAQLAIGAATGLDPANVVLSWSFSTQSVDDTFEVLALTVPAQVIAVQPTGLTTKQADSRFFGKANIYVGTTSVPYYLTKSATPADKAVLTSFWTAAGPPAAGLDPTSRNLTRFNPVPKKTADLTIPLLVTVPNATAAAGACAKPAAGWPVAIVQHGLGRNRTDALAIADAFADACFIVAAIDLPLHGLTDTANPFYQAANERTFNVDLVNNTTGAAPGDGKIDPSGQHMINLSSPLTSRDNLRQGDADLIVFTKSVAKLDITGDGVSDIDPTRISYVAQSLGSIIGGSHLHFAGDTRTATLSVPGGVITKLLLDSPTFGGSIRAGLAALGLIDNSTIFNNFFRDVQTIIDGGDPFNHIFDAQRLVPLHLQKVVGDTVVPNSATDRLIVAGKLKKISTVGPTPVGEGTGGYTTMSAGSHGSLFDPTASAAATVEMQTQAVKFAASATQPGGPFVVITNPAVVQQ